MKYLLIIAIVFCIIPSNVLAQSAPSNRLINWKKAGLDGEKKYANTTINMLANGADSNGIIACDAIMQNAIIANPNGAIIYFPSGIYLFQSTVNLPSNFVIKGGGSANTQLLFNGNGAQDFIVMRGNKNSIKNKLKFNLNKYANQLITDSTPVLIDTTNTYLLLADNDSINMYSTWAYGSSGQIFKVISSSLGMPYTIDLDQQARRNFVGTNRFAFQYISPVMNSGVECLKIKRLDSTIGQTNNILMDNVVNCWVMGVESELTNFAHVLINESKNCEVSNSWFHNAWRYGDGGQGYGVVCQFSASDNLIANNCFHHLRHSMLLQAGANGNVYAYNYSTDVNWVNIVPNSAGDIAIHGNYPYCNLFEGNIVSHIWSDNSHGKNGPYNTFLRNRSTNYGVSITNGDSVNLIGNEIISYTPFYSNWNLNTSVGHYIYGNQVVNSASIFDAIPVGSANVLDTSFAFNFTPNYIYYINRWPLLGYANVANTSTNGAKDRYTTNAQTQCADIPLLAKSIENLNFSITPNPAVNFIYIQGVLVNSNFSIYNLMGIKLINEKYNGHAINISNLQNGIYILKVHEQILKFEKQ